MERNLVGADFVHLGDTHPLKSRWISVPGGTYVSCLLASLLPDQPPLGSIGVRRDFAIGFAALKGLHPTR